MSAPLRCLDLFCGAGPAGEGYTRAGFDVFGVDLHPMPRNASMIAQADVTKLSPRFLRMFDLVHASPPCQAHTDLKHAKGAKPHDDLIPATRALLQAAGVPYVIENVEGAPLQDPVTLCGSMFGLGVQAGETWFQLQRHRLFEASFPIIPLDCAHTSPVIGVYGGHVRCRSARHGGRGTRDFIGFDKPRLAHEAMGFEPGAYSMNEISQALPWAYTHHIGKCFRAWLALDGDQRGKAAA